ncbi:MAG: hypothetical protein DRI57_04885 [Deltaproteobacteria bacterium]|nr:MAG: hypothetical protein DRI57_04885 [Deltaproteobacteria bacterium]
MSRLSLSGNQLSGEIPPKLGNLTSLSSLSLYGNQLSGKIPSELGNLTSLRTLRLGNNRLSGALPASLTSLSNMIRFSFNDTDLCEPTDTAFQSWLSTISESESTGVPCMIPNGDVDGNESVGLSDAILILKMLTGTGPGDVRIYSEADINGDGEIGTEELIYILRELSK